MSTRYTVRIWKKGKPAGEWTGAKEGDFNPLAMASAMVLTLPFGGPGTTVEIELLDERDLERRFIRVGEKLDNPDSQAGRPN